MKRKIDGDALIGIGIGAVIAGLAIEGYKAVKKLLTDINKSEKQSTTNLKKAGVDKTFEKKVVKKVNKFEKNAFIKSAFYGFTNNENFSKDMLYSTDSGVDVNADQHENGNLIRVREVVDERNRKNIEFLLEIPGYFDPEFGFNLGDYVRCCDKAASYMWERIVITCIRPKKRLVGFVGYDRINPNKPKERIAETIEITPEFTESYKKNPESNHDGIYDFVKDYNKMFYDAEILSGGEDEVCIEPTQDLLEFLGLTKEDDVRVFEVFMAYKISFPEKFWNPKDKQYQGIDVAKTLKCLNYLLKEFKIIKKNDEDTADLEDIIDFDKFDSVMFQALDSNDDYNLNYYYIIDKKTDEIVTTEYRYDIIE